MEDPTPGILTEQSFPKIISCLSVGILFLVSLMYLIVMFTLIVLPTFDVKPYEDKAVGKQLQDHIFASGPLVLGIPMMGLTAFVLVIALPGAVGAPIKINIGGVTFDTVSSALIYWMLCFLVLCYGCHLVMSK